MASYGTQFNIGSYGSNLNIGSYGTTFNIGSYGTTFNIGSYETKFNIGSYGSNLNIDFWFLISDLTSLWYYFISKKNCFRVEKQSDRGQKKLEVKKPSIEGQGFESLNKV